MCIRDSTYDPRPQVMERCREQLRRWRYAYAIGSVHLIGRVSVSRSTFYEEVEDVYKRQTPGRAMALLVLGVGAGGAAAAIDGGTAVSYTHLDVYKRQVQRGPKGGIAKVPLAPLCKKSKKRAATSSSYSRNSNSL